MPEIYSIGTHAELTVRAEELTRLLGVSFAAYNYVIEPSEGFVKWFLSRPGMSAQLSMATRDAKGELVSSLFVTDMAVRLGERQREAAVIDTVMTAPEHRGRGLATRLLDMAIDGARARGREAMLLFTGRDSRPEALYSRRGFVRVAELALMVGRPRGSASKMTSSEPSDALQWAEEGLASRPGFRSSAGAYGAWRLGGGMVRSTVAGAAYGLVYAIAPLTHAGAVVPHAVLTDAVGLLTEDAVAFALGSLAEHRVLLCCDTRDTTIHAGALKAGLSVAEVEVAMVHALTPAAGAAIRAGCDRPWYPMMESIVGV